jgi:hypothetical protein
MVQFAVMPIDDAKKLINWRTALTLFIVEIPSAHFISHFLTRSHGFFVSLNPQ